MGEGEGYPQGDDVFNGRLIAKRVLGTRNAGGKTRVHIRCLVLSV